MIPTVAVHLVDPKGPTLQGYEMHFASNESCSIVVRRRSRRPVVLDLNLVCFILPQGSEKMREEMMGEMKVMFQGPVNTIMADL